MEGFARNLARQLARPTGWVGRLLGGAMDFANRAPTRIAVELLDPRAGEHILDVGCGTGAAAAALLRRTVCHVTGIDRSQTMVLAARRRLGDRAKFHRYAIEDLPHSFSGFDGALALNVLYFADLKGRMIGRVKEALRPGGRLVVYVTHRNSMERWAFAREGFHRLYDEFDLVAALECGGFARDGISVQSVPIARSVTGLFAIAIA